MEIGDWSRNFQHYRSDRIDSLGGGCLLLVRQVIRQTAMHFMKAKTLCGQDPRGNVYMAADHHRTVQNNETNFSDHCQALSVHKWRLLIFVLLSRVRADCVWYGIADHTDPDHPKYRIYNGPAKPLGDPKAYQSLTKLCPNYAQGPDFGLCCDADQLNFFAESSKLAYEMLRRCPACWANFRLLLCGMTCDPNQHEFIVPQSVGDMVISAQVNLTARVADTFFNSCKIASHIYRGRHSTVSEIDVDPDLMIDSGNLIHRLRAWLEDKLSQGFSILGRSIATHPFVSLSVSSVVSIALCAGLSLFSVTTNPVELWSAADSRSRLEKNYFDQNFAPFYRTEQLIVYPVNQSFFWHMNLHPLSGDALFGPALQKDFLTEVCFVLPSLIVRHCIVVVVLRFRYVFIHFRFTFH
ncbi:unnamed protein product [Echinostoma caproni]|uniref:NPC1_N domain-containing protein n=1 Tax=Echinostoma caproni TaxID=27848 RepID=A0A183AX30_9TREM|nr:unnamed protein product [Echinostoma caproni]